MRINLEEMTETEENAVLSRIAQSKERGLQYIAEYWSNTLDELTYVRDCKSDLDSITYAIINACGNTVHEAYVKDNGFCRQLVNADRPATMPLHDGYYAMYYAGYLSIWLKAN